jgi:DUF1365 family protein
MLKTLGLSRQTARTTLLARTRDLVIREIARIRGAERHNTAVGEGFVPPPEVDSEPSLAASSTQKLDEGARGKTPDTAVVPRLVTASVRHERMFPRKNTFTYRLYYLALPLSQLPAVNALAVDRPSLVSFRQIDHGPRDGSCLRSWLDVTLNAQGFSHSIDEVILIAMPRTLGYAFNPVSFWLCLDAEGALRAVLCEVNNTFGETHCYLCCHDDQRPISPEEWLGAQKCFHVSPFLPRTGYYFFKFNYQPDTLSVWIHYHDAHGQRKLITSLQGSLSPLTARALRHAAWAHPWVGVKTMFLIHWQALKLWYKRIQFYRKPEQLGHRISKTDAKFLQRAHAVGQRIMARAVVRDETERALESKSTDKRRV